MATMRTSAGRIAGARRTIHRLLAVAALAAATIAGTAAPAHANHTWSLTDGFHYDPADRWSILPVTTSGPAGGHFSNNSQWAHTGSRYAYLWAESGGWVDLRRSFTVEPVRSFGYAICRGEVWLRAVTATAEVRVLVQEPGGDPAPPVAIITSLSPSSGWQRFGFSYNAISPFPYLQVVLYNQAGGPVQDIRVDDFYILCEVIQ